MVGSLTAQVRVFAIVLTVAALAACARYPLFSYKSTPSEERSAAAPKGDKQKIARFAPKSDKEQLASATSAVVVVPAIFGAKHRMAAVLDRELKQRDASYGVASFYGSGERTANGEKFNPRDMTAAHRHLPFGTRVRVTDVKTGKSVTVRINDRGPFIAGRIVDVSPAAAEQLGMVGRGIAQVKLDVVAAN
jgi:rare lipoprotein A